MSVPDRLAAQLSGRHARNDMKIDVGLRLSDITFDGAKPDDI
jgi:hypothetical protein